KRYCMLIIGLVINSFGVALITKGSLGSSPIASVPFALSLAFPQLTLGTWCAIFDIFLVLLQFIILKGKMEKRDIILQVILSFGFGLFCDIGSMVFSWVHPASYIENLVCLLCGTVFFGFGVNFELTGNISMLPGNAFPKAVAIRLGKEYPPCRVACDISFTVISGIISLVALGKLVSVREGTVIAAFLVGNMVKLVKKLLLPLWNKLAEWVKHA
ncbi:MAG: DUF6198 family protein, partial [Bacillota bacterium]|nr:DUF6198 family protein [Bacillota bacterium]